MMSDHEAIAWVCLFWFLVGLALLARHLPWPWGGDRR